MNKLINVYREIQKICKNKPFKMICQIYENKPFKIICQNFGEIFIFLQMSQEERSPTDKKYLDKLCKSLVSPRESPKLDNSDQAEIIEIPTPSGEHIALFLKRADNPLPGNPILLFTHGDGETIDDYYNNHEFFCPYGVSFCIFDYRGNGYSEGTIQTSSVRETEDCFTVIQYLKDQGFGKFSFFGRSLGATCGIFVASRIPDLVCIALDSPMINYKDCTIYQVNKFNHVPIEKAEELYDEACKIVKEKYGIDFLNIEQPIDAAPKINQPIFVCHGKKDVILPFNYSEKLMEKVASQEKRFEALPNGHNNIYPRYKVFMDMFIFILHHYGVEINEFK